jgi:hypothetical protein
VVAGGTTPPTRKEQQVSEQPDGPDDVPAEVPDRIDPAAAVIEPTPLDEDTSGPADPGALTELQALVGEL